MTQIAFLLNLKKIAIDVKRYSIKFNTNIIIINILSYGEI